MTATTRHLTITGDTPAADVIGLRVRVHSHEHGPLVGVVESLEATRPVVRFGNARWQYGESRLAVLVDQTIPLSSPPCAPHAGCDDCGICHACGAVLDELVVEVS